MGKNTDDLLTSIWHLVSDEQKIAYLDAAASNCMPLSIASVALNDPDDEVATTALVSAVDCAYPEGFQKIINEWLLQDNWRMREAALRICEKFHQFPGEKLVVQLFANHPEDAVRLCEELDAWQQVVEFCSMHVTSQVWNTCYITCETSFYKAQCVREQTVYYNAYCGLYELWARYRPEEATQSAEEQAACFLFKAWIERYADAGQTAKSEAAAET